MAKFERVKRPLTDAERERMRTAASDLQASVPSLREISQTIPRTTIQLRVTAEMHAALSEYCRMHDTDISTLLRTEALKKIGRRDLLSAMPTPGRPAAAE